MTEFENFTLPSFPTGYRALVIGASGSIGAAFHALLAQDVRCAQVVGLHRQSQPPMDFDDEASIAAAAAHLAPQGKFHLMIAATGVLHTGQFMPEKRLADLNYTQMEQKFRTNTLGPAMVLRRFAPLLDTQRGQRYAPSAGWFVSRAHWALFRLRQRSAALVEGLEVPVAAPFAASQWEALRIPR